MLISEVIEKVIAFHPDLGRESRSDGVKYGNPEKECTGVVTTCCGTIEVIRAAAAAGANLLIVHEPLFWGNTEDPSWVSADEVYQAKKKVLDETGMVIFRDHDHIHGPGWGDDRTEVDGIFYGIMKELGWEKYLIGNPLKPLLYRLPETDATVLGQELKEKLGLSGLRIVGDPHAMVSTVFLCEHVNSDTREHPGNDKILDTIKYNADAVIPLECIDWTLSYYVRDSSFAGRPRILYNTGHFNLEELGMKYLARSVQELVGDLPVQYISSGDAYGFIV